MSQISVNDVTFCYEGSYDNIFEHVSFQIDTDWKLGFIGRNGRGKTTFLNLLLGKYEYHGSIKTDTLFDYFPFSISTKEQERNTIDMIETIDPDYEFWKICRELNFLEVDADVLYRPFFTLSHGEQTKVMLAILFTRENRFLLIDEPTNHLDMRTREVVVEYLKQKKGFILVSHDKWFLDSCIDHVLVINKENISVEKGNFSSWWENKRRQDEFELSENEKLKKEIKKLEESAKRTQLWADKVEGSKIGFNPRREERNIDTRAYIGEKSRRMQQRRKNLERRQENAIEDKSKLLKNIESAESLKIIPLTHHKETLVYAKELSLCYGEKNVVSDISFAIKNGERMVLQGKNGCGKSSIIKSILTEAGHQFLKSGSLSEKSPINLQRIGLLEVASGIKISYISQDTSYLSGSLEEFAAQYGLEERLFKALLRKLDLERIQFGKQLTEYSEGQKKKVLIAKSLCEQAHLYIWDEPLNFIDIFSRMQIEDLILKYQPTMLIVEHDRSFCEKIATKQINLS